MDIPSTTIKLKLTAIQFDEVKMEISMFDDNFYDTDKKIVDAVIACLQAVEDEEFQEAFWQAECSIDGGEVFTVWKADIISLKNTGKVELSRTYKNRKKTTYEIMQEAYSAVVVESYEHFNHNDEEMDEEYCYYIAMDNHQKYFSAHGEVLTEKMFAAVWKKYLKIAELDIPGNEDEDW